MDKIKRLIIVFAGLFAVILIIIATLSSAKPRLVIQSKTEGARLIMDGVEVPINTEIRTTRGKHRIVVYAENYKKLEKDITTNFFGKKVISLELTNLGAPPSELPHEGKNNSYILSFSYDEFGQPSYLVVFYSDQGKAEALSWLDSKGIAVNDQFISFEEDGD